MIEISRGNKTNGVAFILGRQIFLETVTCGQGSCSINIKHFQGFALLHEVIVIQITNTVNNDTDTDNFDIFGILYLSLPLDT